MIDINIGVDIDGVINDLFLFHVSCGAKYCYENGIKIEIKSQNMDSTDIFGWQQSIDTNFWHQYYLDLLLYCDFIRPFVSDVTEYLRNMGHKIYIISSRQDSDLPRIEERSMLGITRDFLINGNIHYDELYFATDKWKIINSLGIDIMIEDNPSFFMTHAQTNRIPLVCFDTPYNQNVTGTNIFRAYSWYEILYIIDKLHK